jgi:hypothetical protein
MAAETFCSAFETVSVMVRHGLLRSVMITESYGAELRMLWPKVKPFVDVERASRDPTRWRACEDIAAMARAKEASMSARAMAENSDWLTDRMTGRDRMLEEPEHDAIRPRTTDG